MKTLRVKVVRGNKPVPMATVVVTGSGLVLHGQTYTAMDGITGSDPQGDAIVITTELYEATDDPKAPSSHFSPGFVARVCGLCQIKGFVQCGGRRHASSTSRTPRKGSP